MLVSAPLILLLLDYWPLDRIRTRTSETSLPAVAPAKAGGRKSEVLSEWSVVSRLILEKIPLLLLSAGSCVITFVVQQRAIGAIPPLPWLWRAENAVASYVLLHLANIVARRAGGLLSSPK